MDMDRVDRIRNENSLVLPVDSIKSDLSEVFSLAYQGDILGNITDIFCEDLQEIISYSNDIKPEFSFLQPEINERKVIINNQQKISFLNKLIGKQVQNLEFEYEGKKCNYFRVYIDFIVKCEDENSDDDEDDSDPAVYITPTYRLIDGRTMDENPSRMYDKIYIDEIKKIVIDNKEYLFLG